MFIQMYNALQVSNRLVNYPTDDLSRATKVGTSSNTRLESKRSIHDQPTFIFRVVFSREEMCIGWHSLHLQIVKPSRGSEYPIELALVGGGGGW